VDGIDTPEVFPGLLFDRIVAEFKAAGR